MDSCQQWSVAFLDFVRTFLSMRTRMGRPPKSGLRAMEGRLEIRVNPEEKAAYAIAAEQVGMDRSDWIRATLNAEANRVLPSDPA